MRAYHCMSRIKMPIVASPVSIGVPEVRAQWGYNSDDIQ